MAKANNWLTAMFRSVPHKYARRITLSLPSCPTFSGNCSQNEPTDDTTEPQKRLGARARNPPICVSEYGVRQTKPNGPSPFQIAVIMIAPNTPCASCVLYRLIVRWVINNSGTVAVDHLEKHLAI
jgi:hypothetical protein